MSKFSQDNGYQAFRILQVAFIIAPIIAGIDKFFKGLADWTMYLNPHALQMLGKHSELFMRAVGVIEIIVGIGVIFKPKIFAYIVSVWLLLIIINLLLTGHFIDIALRDFGLMLAAFALARLSHKYKSFG